MLRDGRRRKWRDFESGNKKIMTLLALMKRICRGFSIVVYGGKGCSSGVKV